MSSPVRTTLHAAEVLDVSEWKVRKLAKQLRVGYNVGGQSGWRFTDAEIDRMRDSMRPSPATPQRRRRRRAVAAT